MILCISSIITLFQKVVTVLFMVMMARAKEERRGKARNDWKKTQ